MLTDLPLDLESEILSRVPATSLQRLKTTCKRWYALFRDPRFVKKNLGKAATHVIFDNRSGYSMTDINSLIHSINLRGIQNSFDPSIGVDVKLNVLKDPRHDKISHIISHCDGLLLCKTEDYGRLVVWNPCTGQIKWIQANNMLMDVYVLGYVNNNKSCNSYKILNFGILPLNSSHDNKSKIYEFNSDSWRILDHVSPGYFAISKAMTLKGNAYWFASDWSGTKTRTRIYFAKEGIQVHQEIAQKPKKCGPFLVSYVPSLVQIQSGNKQSS
ncbi:unnamed protein product [Arabidopsis thaliana]|uniref:Putative F-box protein At3g24700 n=1 Tax=Arabidopsis thaliana TaxID=3702 RepID=FB185_ARATH|nr:F-box and associated interaction domains-containing protein [Arabidopsis thaliana]Q9LJ39.1 RecName: Full=Putative F-box protein At3g24700 [Arabidopsis thaliana]ANM66009.1 F-box and associated interaction domains-containing protein [Arabidopsis thaliana]BAB01219.1 unnamed protein product [Arabidopsis thaliana]|eukprot:NP_001327936.1 F-box and associated interaction domains-containing protein [Arabidopsis thaliana]